MSDNPMTFTNKITGQTVQAQPWQTQLKPGDYYLIAAPIIYLNGETFTGPTVYGQILPPAREEEESLLPAGFHTVRAYSQWSPDGELGLFCIVDATRQLTEAEFEDYRSLGWPAEVPNG